MSGSSRTLFFTSVLMTGLLSLTACGGSSSNNDSVGGVDKSQNGSASDDSSSNSGSSNENENTDNSSSNNSTFSPGNPDGNYPLTEPVEAEDTSNPDHVVGTGTPASCTDDAFIDAVALGGVVTFDCGDEPVTITLSEPAKIFNDASAKTVIDGGGLVTLDGNDQTRILYMNTCDQSLVWTSETCNNQATPYVVVQNITFANGNSTAETQRTGGGAIWARGGRLRIVNSAFYNNQSKATGPDTAGGAIYVFSQYENSPVYIVNSTIGGSDEHANIASNGGGIGGLGTSYTLINSVVSHNKAIGNGGNPAKENTPGGGSGGGIYMDGNTIELRVLGSIVEKNSVNEYGSGIFFTTNDLTGNIRIQDSRISKNEGGSWYPVYPQISMHDVTAIDVINSIIEE